ncbi:peptide chain release factor N(5)-glutamine methyltransferase [Paenibacillus sp. ACRRX]|uniref:peptide chain release factor N(5)-glutamine methyltransferase n=1 Tax=Paenibacillus sp. ACRRX TaxID=2918206 RepID=UPI001EF3EA5D|nr:peptide chain release factor N(5)-glutamine methyltransferase [Paenibacillus sp. ACRRX]MCG7408055.1 peptide chain release factor N(5)-glutamine methyltransferase [Paenibacillus sp. ACRRX]
MINSGNGDGTQHEFRLELPLTIREAWLQASSCLSASSVADGQHHAELLLRHALGWERAAYLSRLLELLPEAAAAAYGAMIARRALGEPTQYIMGEAYFYGLRFEVSADVLIPRPETELLVEAVLEETKLLYGDLASLRAADIGTGSGAIACTLAYERPEWQLVAVDISPGALQMARHNAAMLHVDERIEWLEGDLIMPLQGRLPVDILISNPPYIPEADMLELQREVRDFEPHTALVGGADGLDPYRRIMGMLSHLSERPRMLAFELGQGQAPEVAALVEQAGYTEKIRIVQDLAGIERHVIGIRPL